MMVRFHTVLFVLALILQACEPASDPAVWEDEAGAFVTPNQPGQQTTGHVTAYSLSVGSNDVTILVRLSTGVEASWSQEDLCLFWLQSSFEYGTELPQDIIDACANYYSNGQAGHGDPTPADEDPIDHGDPTPTTPLPGNDEPDHGDPTPADEDPTGHGDPTPAHEETNPEGHGDPTPVDPGDEPPDHGDPTPADEDDESDDGEDEPDS